MKEEGGDSSSPQSSLKHQQIGIDEWTANSRDQQHQRGGGGEHKIVHLTSRPTQLYYFQQDGPELSGFELIVFVLFRYPLFGPQAKEWRVLPIWVIRNTVFSD